MKPLADCRVTVVGLGLMGASLCMDLVRGGLCREVRGVARRTDTVLEAFFSGAVDEATNDVQTGVLGADIVILATPVRTIVSTLDEIGPVLWPGTVVMDMGSTKVGIMEAMARLPAGIEPVGGHPMCGKETAGFAAAEPGLYHNAPWVLAPLERTSGGAVELARALALAVGARPLVVEAQRHDRVVASISHLPYVVASALVQAVAVVGADDPLVWEIAAGGFRDTSRVAASDTHMFLDILMTNRSAVLEQIAGFGAQLEIILRLLEAGDEDALCALLGKAQALRAAWKQQQQL